MKILCPTDFSDHSLIAVEYALNLANTLGAEIHILAAFEINKSSTSFISIEEVVRSNHEEDMKKLLLGLGTLVKVDNTPITKVMKGSAVPCILRYAKHFDIDLIVMGTQGGNSLRTILFGSTTRKLAGKTPIPLLAIPEDIKHTLTSNRIVLTLDDKILEKESVFRVPLEIARALSQKIDILHIERKDELIPIDPFISAYLDDTMGEVIIEKNKDVISAIKSYAEKHNVGMLMMVRRDKSMLEKLLTVGNTAAELAKTNIPLMVLPEQ